MAIFLIKSLFVCFCAVINFSVLNSKITRDDTDVFTSWIDGKGEYRQCIFSDVNVQKMSKRQSSEALKSCFLRYPKSLAALNFYFDHLLDGKPVIGNESLLLEHFKTLYPMLQSDIGAFLDYLDDHEFSSKIYNRIEKNAPHNPVIGKYNAFMHLLFAHTEKHDEREHLFSVANNFFEYCFSPKTFLSFKKRLKNSCYHPLARLLYSVIWKQLAGNGWKEWHASCLQGLKKACDDGKTIVYIAGGCDIYQLIKQGIYNIRIVDPILPTQPAYYAEHWWWLVKRSSKNPGIGDCLRFTFNDKSIVMKRSGYSEKGSFTCRTKRGAKRSIPQSITQWTVYEDNQKVGTVTFDRRFCKQKDFLPDKSKQLLISFNELYYITSTEEPDSWNINPLKFKPAIKLQVKQLRKPLNKQVLCNMVQADQLPFSFIRLGSCAD
jgi:hypothetical protein